MWGEVFTQFETKARTFPQEFKSQRTIHQTKVLLRKDYRNVSKLYVVHHSSHADNATISRR